MKKTILLLTIILFSFSGLKSFGQMVFSVSPGISLNGAQFGYKINGKLVPYISIQYMRAGFNLSESSTDWDYDLNAAAEYTDKEELSGSVFIPSIGVKYFFKQGEKLHAYFNASISKPMVSGEIKFNGEVEEELDEIISNISFWGGQIGFGTEYFVDENFSIGGEFGLSWLKFGYSQTYETDYWNPNTSQYIDTDMDIEVNANVLPTYSRISLNFYF